MTASERSIKKYVEDFVPPMSERYKKLIADTVSELRARGTKGEKLTWRAWKPFAAAASVFAAALLSAAAVFGTRPALAAEIPVVNGVVYAAAPETEANETERERLEALLSSAFRLLAARDYDAAAGCFRNNSLGGRENYLAAAYVDHLLTFGDMFPNGAKMGEIGIEDLRAEKKAFRFSALVTLELVSRDGARIGTEECAASVFENAEGMRIERIEMLSEGYRSFASGYEDVFGPVCEGASVGMVPIDSAFMSYTRVLSETEGARDRADRLKNMLSELEKAPASPAEKADRAQLIRAELEKAEADITPEAVSVEDAAGELMYRYWLGRKTGETGDFSDIVERNESTDLFLWDARLAAERTALGVLKPLETVERGEARILEMTEADGLIAAKLYVHIEISDGISRGVGEEIVLTLRRSGGRLVIVGFDREVGDGLYVNSLKPLANRYRTQGLSWREAGEKAYEALHAQLENEAEWAANYGKTDDGR